MGYPTVTLSMAARAAHWPDRTALVDVAEDRRDAPAATVSPDRLSYEGLAELVASASAVLAERGVGAGDVVSVCSRNRVGALTVCLACLDRGATFAPLSHRLTPATIDRPVERLDPTLVWHEPAQQDLIRAFPHELTISLDALERDVPADPADAVDTAGVDQGSGDVDLERDGSGSVRDGATAHDTGPAVAFYDRSRDAVATFDEATMACHCVAAATTWGYCRDDCLFLLGSLSTPHGLFRVTLPALSVGATLAFDRAFDPGDALAAIRRLDVTALAGRGAELRELIAHADAAEALSGIDWIAAEGGLDPVVAEAYSDAGVPVAGAYGPMTCPNALAVSPERAGAVRGGGDGPAVGRPVLDARVRLVGADGESVLSGAGVGHLQVAGPLVADAFDEGPDRSGWRAAPGRFRRDRSGDYHRLDG